MVRHGNVDKVDKVEKVWQQKNSGYTISGLLSKPGMNN